jgi:hypothetical protein
MAYEFNGSVLNWSGITFGINSFSEDGGQRPEIDITTSTDSRRKSLVGLAAPQTLNFGFVYAGERTSLVNSLEGCTASTLNFSVRNNCGASSLISDELFYLMSYDLSGDLDGTVTGSLSLMKQ